MHVVIVCCSEGKEVFIVVIKKSNQSLQMTNVNSKIVILLDEVIREMIILVVKQWTPRLRNKTCKYIGKGDIYVLLKSMAMRTKTFFRSIVTYAVLRSISDMSNGK